MSVDSAFYRTVFPVAGAGKLQKQKKIKMDIPVTLMVAGIFYCGNHLEVRNLFKNMKILL